MAELLPADVWVQVGTDNMGRFMVPGSDDAIYWLTRAIEGRQAMIKNECLKAQADGEVDLTTSNVVSLESHYPALWRRGGELVQQVLYTQGMTARPGVHAEELDEVGRHNLELGMTTTEAAFKAFHELVSHPTPNALALYDARVLYSLAHGDVPSATAAVRDCQVYLDKVVLGLSPPQLQACNAWLDNMKLRISDYCDHLTKLEAMTTTSLILSEQQEDSSTVHDDDIVDKKRKRTEGSMSTTLLSDTNAASVVI
jgi:hypothetical protein